MKKKGAALVTVLVIFTALIIIATSISSAVINSAKLNKRYSENIDLELAAKSGVNIIKEDFISRVNSESDDIKIETLKDVEAYRDKVNSSSWEDLEIINNFFDEYSKNNIQLSVSISLGLNSEGKNTLKIKSVAKNEGTVNVEKVEEQSLVLNIKDTGTTGDSNLGGSNTGNDQDTIVPSLVFNKLFNIGKDIISFGDSKQEAINQFEYGGQCCELTVNNGQNVQKPTKNESLSKLNINLNLDIISNIISNYDTTEATEHNRSSISLENKTVVYKKLDGDNLNINVKKSNILFETGGSSGNDSKIEYLDESEIIINGNSSFSKLNIASMNNSKLIINGDLSIYNEFSVNQQNSTNKNNLILINGNLNINGPKINLKDSIIIVSGNFNVSNQLNLEMQNSAIICIKNNEKENKGEETGGLNFGTNPTITNYNGSYLYCSGNFKVGNVMNINNYGDTTPESSFVNQIINEFLTISNN